MPSPSRPDRPSGARCWPGLLALSLAVAATAPAPATASHQDPDADVRAGVLRAMFVLKLAPYLPPATPRQRAEAYRIGLVGHDPVVDVAPRHLVGKKVEDLRVAVIVVTPEAAAEGTAADQYDLLYIAASIDDETLRRIVASHRQRPIPLVCERGGFADHGGGVQLFVRDNGLRFEANADALRRQGLKPSPQLLKLSRKGPA